MDRFSFLSIRIIRRKFFRPIPCKAFSDRAGKRSGLTDPERGISVHEIVQRIAKPQGNLHRRALKLGQNNLLHAGLCHALKAVEGADCSGDISGIVEDRNRNASVSPLTFFIVNGITLAADARKLFQERFGVCNGLFRQTFQTALCDNLFYLTSRKGAEQHLAGSRGMDGGVFSNAAASFS